MADSQKRRTRLSSEPTGARADSQKRRPRLLSAPAASGTDKQNRGGGQYPKVSHKQWQSEKRHSYTQQHTVISSKEWRIEKPIPSVEEGRRQLTGGLNVKIFTTDIVPNEDVAKDLEDKSEENEKLKKRLEELTADYKELLVRNEQLREFVEFGMGKKLGAVDVANIVEACVTAKRIESLQAELQAKSDTESRLRAVIEETESESQDGEIRRLTDELRNTEYDNKSLKDKVSDLKGDKEFLSNRIEDITSVIAGNIKDTEKTLTAMKGVLDEGTSAWKQDVQRRENEKFQKFLCYGNENTINYSAIRITADRIDKDWETLGRFLLLKVTVLAEIEKKCDNTEDKAFQMLAVWFHMNRHEASLGTLKNALERIPRRDIVEEISDAKN